ncbi:MAG: sugar phosphate isomerase/epimerase, partial [Planctomycetes bacterium]|nr:sugar phosphate isomerase/epimerase [Planctomycetota bacterium]
WFERRDLFFTDEQRAAEIRETSKELGIENSYHAFYYDEWDLGQQDVEAATVALRKQIAASTALGAKLMTIHLGSYAPELGRAATMQQVIEAIGKAASFAEKKGVVITIENFTLCHGDRFLGDRTEDFALLFEKVTSPAIALNLDIGHANVTGNLDELLTRFGDRLRNIHLHDTDGETDGHAPPGEGTVNWERVFDLLKAIPYTGPINLEFHEKHGKFTECISMIRSA